MAVHTENGSAGRSGTPRAPVLHGVIGADRNGRITSFNDAAELLLGFARDTVVGHKYHEVLVPERLRDSTSLSRYGPQSAEAPLGTTVTVPVLTVTGEERDVMLTTLQSGPEPTHFAGWFTPADPSELAFPAAMGGTELGNFTIAGDGSSFTMSDSLWRMHGEDEPRAISFDDYVRVWVHPGDQEKLRTRLRRRQVGTRLPELMAWRIIRPDGEVRALLGDGRAVYNEDGSLARLAGIARDVTDTEGTNQALRAHRAVEDALALWSSPRGGFTGVLRSLTETMAWRCGALWMKGEESGQLRCQAFWIRPDERPSELERQIRATEHAIGSGVAGRAWKSGELVSSDPGDEGPPSLAFPIADADTLAVLEFFTDDAPFVASELRQTLEQLGHGRLDEFCLRHQADLGLSPITERERQVLQLGADGGAIHTIAATLGISASTVKTHFEHLYSKLGVSDRGGAVAEGFRRGLIH